MKMSATILFVCTLLQITQVDSVKRVFNARRTSDTDVQSPQNTAGGLKSTKIKVPKLSLSSSEETGVRVKNSQDGKVRGPFFIRTPERQTRGLVGTLLSSLDATFSIIGNLKYQAYKYTSSMVRSIVYFPYNISKTAFQWTKNITDAVISRAKGILTGESETEIRALKVGKFILTPAVLALEEVVHISHVAESFGPKLLKKVLKSSGLTLKELYISVSAFELPGWGYVLYLPNKVISVVDTTRGQVVKIIHKKEEMLRAGEAFMIYQFLNVISRKANILISSLGKDCTTLKTKSVPVENPIVHEIDLGRLQLCGLSKFKLLNNVKVWKNTEDSLIIQAWFVNKQLTANTTNATVLGYGQVKLLDNEEIGVRMKKMAIAAQVVFKKGTIIEFVKLSLKVAELKGFQLKILNKNERTEMMDVIENLSPVVGDGVQNTINSQLRDMGRLVTEDIQQNPLD